MLRRNAAAASRMSNAHAVDEKRSFARSARRQQIAAKQTLA
jgi:hypothetical protein